MPQPAKDEVEGKLPVARKSLISTSASELGRAVCYAEWRSSGLTACGAVAELAH